MFGNWANDKEVTKYLTWLPHGNIEVTRKVISDWVKLYERDDYYNWVIEYEGRAIGNISVVDMSNENLSCALGYCLGKAYWNRGIMTEACRAVIDYLFGEVGFNRIAAWHAEPNTGSGRVMQKCAMTREGVFRQRRRAHSGEYLDIVNYSVLYEEWVNQKDVAGFLKYPCVFNGFITLPRLSDGEISLVCIDKKPADPEKKYVPCYTFLICGGAEIVGSINFRIGYTEGLFYGGNIGYSVVEPYRGKGIAGRACRLIIPVAKAHGMKTLRISNDVNNIASRRVCEKLGATHIKTARLPEWTDMYKEGHRYENLFDWTFHEAGKSGSREDMRAI
jgi:ribosomal-protein-alanine N-acetyltransferase